jgi:hypothetical protein
MVFLALPAFAAAAGILHVLDVPLDSPKGWLASDWIATAGSVGLITALGGVAMFVFLCGLVEQRYAFLTTYVVFLGAAPFPYATMLFSHAAVIGILCIALWAIADPVFWPRMIRTNRLGHYSSPTGVGEGGRRAGEGCGAENNLHGEEAKLPSTLNSQPSTNTPWLLRHLVAGLCCGLAISSEYTAAIAAGGVLALALFTSFKRGAVLALAAIPPLLLIPIYNWLCFGGPLAFGYHHLALTEFQEMNKGLFGITFPPKLSAAYLILLSPERGLFFWTPFFLMAFFGLKPLWKESRNAFWVMSVVVVLQVISISGYYMPSGGGALGPRHLGPALPFLTVCGVLGCRRWPNLGVLLGSYSLLLTGIATLIEAMPPEDRPDLLWVIYPGMLARNHVAHTIGAQLGLGPLLGICVAIAVLFGPFIRAIYDRNDAPRSFE